MRLLAALWPVVQLGTNVRFHGGRAPGQGLPVPSTPTAGSSPQGEVSCRRCGQPFDEPWDPAEPALCGRCALDRFFYDRDARWTSRAGTLDLRA